MGTLDAPIRDASRLPVARLPTRPTGDRRANDEARRDFPGSEADPTRAERTPAGNLSPRRRVARSARAFPSMTLKSSAFQMKTSSVRGLFSSHIPQKRSRSARLRARLEPRDHRVDAEPFRPSTCSLLLLNFTSRDYHHIETRGDARRGDAAAKRSRRLSRFFGAPRTQLGSRGRY